ncbi:hypothetical protein HDZ31DRAFT_66308 [Schizophyllum fasciatum]
MLVDSESEYASSARRYLEQKSMMQGPATMREADGLLGAIGAALGATGSSALRTDCWADGTRIDYTATRLAVSNGGGVRHVFDFGAQDQRIEYAVLANAQLPLSPAQAWQGSRAQARYPTTAPTPHAPRSTFGPFGASKRIGGADWTDGATVVLALYVFLRGQTVLYALDHLSAIPRVPTSGLTAPPALQISALPVSVRRAWPIFPAGVIVQRALDPDELATSAAIPTSPTTPSSPSPSDDLLPTLFSITSPTSEPGVVAEAPSGGIARVRALTATHEALAAMQHDTMTGSAASGGSHARQDATSNANSANDTNNSSQPIPSGEPLPALEEVFWVSNSSSPLPLLLTARGARATLWRYACVPEKGGLEIRGIWGVGGGSNDAYGTADATLAGADAEPVGAGVGMGPSASSRVSTRDTSSAGPSSLPSLPHFPPALDAPLSMADMMAAAERSKTAPGTATRMAAGPKKPLSSRGKGSAKASTRRASRRIPSADLTAAVDRMALTGGSIGELTGAIGAGKEDDPFDDAPDILEDEDDEPAVPRLLGPSSTRLPIPPLRHNDRVSAHVWVERVGDVDMGPVPLRSAAATTLELADLSAALFDVRDEGTAGTRGLVAIASRSRGKVWVLKVGRDDGRAGDMTERKGTMQGGDATRTGEQATKVVENAQANWPNLGDPSDDFNPFLDPAKSTRQNLFTAPLPQASSRSGTNTPTPAQPAYAPGAMEGKVSSSTRENSEAIADSSKRPRLDIFTAHLAAVIPASIPIIETQKAGSSESTTYGGLSIHANASANTSAALSMADASLMSATESSELSMAGPSMSDGTRPGTPTNATDTERKDVIMAGAHSAALTTRAREEDLEGLVPDLALVTADGHLRILRTPEQALDVSIKLRGGDGGVAAGNYPPAAIPALYPGALPSPDAMDLDPRSYVGSANTGAPGDGALSSRRLVGVEPAHKGGINLVWEVMEPPAPPPPLVLGTRPDDSVFDPVPPSLPGSISLPPPHTQSLPLSPLGPLYKSLSSALRATITRTYLRPRLAPRCALTRRLFHALSLALPAALTWHIYVQWATLVHGGRGERDHPLFLAEAGQSRTDAEFSLFCSALCASLAIPLLSGEAAGVSTSARTQSAFQTLAHSPSSERFREDPALRGLRQPRKVTALSTEPSLLAAKEVPQGAFGSAMWGIHLVFQELSIMPATWVEARRLAPLAIVLALRARPEWADYYTRMCPDDVLQLSEQADANAPAGWPMPSETVPLDDRLPGVAPEISLFCLGKLGTPDW